MGYGNQSLQVIPYSEKFEYSSSTMQSTYSNYGSYSSLPYIGVFVGNYSYRFSYDNSTKIVTVRKVKIANTKGSAFVGLSTTKTFDLNEIGTTGVYLSTTSNFDSCVHYVGGGKLRFCSTAYSNNISVSSGGTCGYYEYDTSDDSLTYHSFLNATGQTIKWGGGTRYVKFLRGNYVLVSDGDYNATTTSSYYWFLINVSTGVIVKSFGLWSSIIPYAVKGAGCSVSYAHNLGTDENLICFVPEITADSGAPGGGSSKYSYLIWVYDVVSDTLYPTNRRSNGNNSPTSISYINGISDNYEFIQTDSGYNTAYLRYKDLMYLATINNLQSAVTKTAAQTMKVTYTLTEV